AVKEAYKYDNKIFVEKYIKGKELTVGIIGDKPSALPIIEIKPKSGFYDYYSKYTRNVTRYIVPAILEDMESKNITNIALECHNIMQCSGISRVDFILGTDNKPYLLEINTMPGMTGTSLVPMAAEACGIDFDTLVEMILMSASLKV
ncbi:MAG: ATP-grasp domain-containing protein, partial [Actinobacteria bacterium]|nr:ATP-grasp domain-containing protein [Actinomycetota bacterium]